MSRFDEGQFKRQIARFESQLRFVSAKSLTQVAEMTRKTMQMEMAARFDRPTPYTLNSGFIRPATKVDLVARYGIKDQVPSKAAKSPAELLEHQFTGGSRAFKRAEGAFRRIGLMSTGEVIVPGKGAQLDRFGNLPRGFLVTLLSYFSAFGEQGYRANATEASKRRRAKVGTTARGFKEVRGVRYFYASGIAGKGRAGHLAKGIYAARGIQSVDIVPVMLFVKVGVYRRRFSIPSTAQVVFASQFDKIFRRNMEQALSTAR
jgi:hypothetical protein